LAKDVIIAEHLDGRPLDSDHGAPARLVSPNQYGFVNVKHLCRIEVHTSEPRDSFGGHPISQVLLRFVQPPSAGESLGRRERPRYLPAWSVQPIGWARTAPPHPPRPRRNPPHAPRPPAPLPASSTRGQT